jgi:hypothetical protein
VSFALHGEVGAELAFDPPTYRVGNIPPHKPTVIQALLYSNRWDDLVVKAVTASHTELKWTIKPADQETVEDRHAPVGRLVCIEIPPGLEHGRCEEWIEVTAAPAADSTDHATCRMNLEGRVYRRLGIYGEITEFGVIDVGSIVRGTAKRTRLRMVVRDEQTELPVRKIETSPDFLRASVTPVNAESPADGRYNLLVEVTKDAPACNYLGRKLGTIRIEFDHPRITPLELKACFAVAGDRL